MNATVPGHTMLLVATFSSGDIVAQKYRVVRALGSGGMGQVMAAHHLALDRPVAIKFMTASAAADAGSVARFFREARAAAKLNSRHVTQVLDVGRLESGLPYIVMELLEGDDFQTILKTRGALPMQESIDYLLEACEAIAEAHGAGIVHRDLKPANLFLARDGFGGTSVKLLDFGISKMHWTATPHESWLTNSHSVLGSPAYMSPEQIRSPRDVDHRSDIWSLGAVLFEMISGCPAWPGRTLGDVISRITNEAPPLLSKFAPSADSTLDTVIARCFEKNPLHRYQTIADLALVLHPLGTERSRATLERIRRISGYSPQTDAAVTLEPRMPAEAEEFSAASAVENPAPPHFEKTLLYGEPAANAPVDTQKLVTPELAPAAPVTTNPSAPVGARQKKLQPNGGRWRTVVALAGAGVAVVGVSVAWYARSPARSVDATAASSVPRVTMTPASARADDRREERESSRPYPAPSTIVSPVGTASSAPGASESPKSTAISKTSLRHRTAARAASPLPSGTTVPDPMSIRR